MVSSKRQETLKWL